MDCCLVYIFKLKIEMIFTCQAMVYFQLTTRSNFPDKRSLEATGFSKHASTKVTCK
jgi:hypothetical protein